MQIAIIGLGYVGLPLAIAAAKKGHNVLGIDVDANKVGKINKGQSPLDDEYIKNNLPNTQIAATTDFSKLSKVQVIVICVPTPVNKKHVPDLSYVESATNSIAKYLADEQVVILESTVYPGTTEEIVQPILDATGKKYYLAHCPERIDPGNTKWTIENIPRVVGGIDDESTKKAADFYRAIIDAEVTEVKTSKEAEATKIMENTFRDINIAFINEMAKSFDKAGIDIMEVIKGASTKPFGFMPHYPGCGVGGHCISVDPYYLIDNAKNYGFDHEFLKLARKINNSMPHHTVKILQEELNRLGVSVKGAKIGVLGLAYKGNVDDTRESPAFPIIEKLNALGAELTVYDPYILDKSDVGTLEELLEKVDYVLLVTDHKQFRMLSGEKLKQSNIKLVVDGRNALDKADLEAHTITYRGIGR